MTQPTKYQYVKLGVNLEYLRGISSASVVPPDSLAAFPELTENLPGRRFEATKVVAALRSLLIQLEEMGLQQSLAAAAEIRPMLAQMETYISQHPAAGEIVLHDGFADKLVSVTKQISLALKRELGSQPG